MVDHVENHPLLSGEDSTSEEQETETSSAKLPPTPCTKQQAKTKTMSVSEKHTCSCSVKKATTTEEENTVGRTKVLIMAVDFPSRLLIDQETLLVKGTLFDRVVHNKSSIKPEFLDISSESGCLVVTCKDEATADWAIAQVPELKPWDGAALCSLAFVKVTAVLPNSVNFTDESNMTVIKRSNPKMNFDKWKVLSRIKEGTDVKLVLSVDPASVDKFKNGCLTLLYGFRKVQLKFEDDRELKRVKDEVDGKTEMVEEDNKEPETEDEEDLDSEEKESNSEVDIETEATETREEIQTSAEEDNVVDSIRQEVKPGLNYQLYKEVKGEFYVKYKKIFRYH